MNVLEAIKARRSVRAFQQQPVRSADVNLLLEAAVHAPSALNSQPWRFAVIQDRERLQRFSDGVKQLALRSVARDAKNAHYEALLRGDAFNVFHGADTLITIGVTQPGPYCDAAAWLCAQNLMLAACAIGLGSCCVGMAVPFLNTPQIKAELALAEAERVIAAIVVGYASGSQPSAPRLPPAISCWLRDATHRAT